MKKIVGDRLQKDLVSALNERAGDDSWNIHRMGRILRNQTRVQPDEVEDIAEVCGVTDQELIAKLKAWAKSARLKGRWEQKRRNLHENLMDLVGYEEQAVVQRIWDPLLIPALCQTAGYASVVMSAMDPHLVTGELDRWVDARIARQAALTGDFPQHLWVLLDERVVRTQIGSADTWVEQLRHLKKMASWPNVTLRVVPTTAAPHPGLSGWFTLMEFADDIPDIAYTDGLGGSLYLEEAQDVRGCTLIFGHLLGIALNAMETIALLDKAVNDTRGLE
ncbi:DUF5753 domain-containing protein [Actinosynnema sp. NPDC020468]|uniref:DUF5753 domain-containing protein n=1 Tax=Actinosynnema sp. NPDC020468 TaxID=3154488 RepID=UPI00340C58CA